MRISKTDYYLGIALKAASLSTCDRKHVGAVLVKNDAIVSTGFNGSARGLPHCDDVGHLIVDNHCVRTLHAEQNAIINAARHGACVLGATCFTTAYPCWECTKALLNAGIARIVYAESYRPNPLVAEACLSLGVALEQWRVGRSEPPSDLKSPSPEE